MRRDDAVSDMVGTAILLGITVSLVGVSVAALYPAQPSRPPAPAVDIRAEAAPSGTFLGAIALTHGGGESLERADLQVQVIQGSQLLLKQAFPGTGLWSLGEEAEIALPMPLSGGERLEIQVVSKLHDAVLTTIPLDVPSSLAALATPTFAAVVLEPTGAPQVQAVSSFRVTAQLDHDEGRKAIESAWVDLTPLGGSPRQALYDDGTHGDEIAGDLVYTAYVEVPLGTPSGYVTLDVGAIDISGRPSSTASFVVEIIGLPDLANLSNVTNIINNLPSFSNPSTVSNLTNLSTLGGGTTVQQLQSIVNNGGGTTLQNLTLLPLAGVPEIREPDPFTPTSDHPNRQVTLSGRNFSYVNSVSFRAADGTEYGVAWFLVNDSSIVLIVPGSVPPDADYRVGVSGPVGNDTSDEWFRVIRLPNAIDSPPAVTDVDPDAGRANDEIKVTGRNLSYVRALTLINGTTPYAASFWTVGSDGEEIRFLVPFGVPAGDYAVTVNSPGGTATAPGTFRVLPSRHLAIDDFTPRFGPPFTQVNITGEGFLNVVAANVGGANVAMWVYNDTHMSILTNPAVPIARFNDVTLFNATGSARECCFDAKASTSQKEYAAYPTSVFERMALNITKSGNSITATLKFNLTNYSFTAGSATYNLTSVTMQSPTFKPGTQVTDSTVPIGAAAPPARLSPVPCGPAGPDRDGMYALTFTQSPKKYDGNIDTLPLLFIFEWTTTANGGNVHQVTVGSTVTGQYFSLGPQSATKTIMDGPDYDWPSTFSSCTP